MIRKYAWPVSLLLVLLVVMGGYFSYQYVKYRPPAFLVKLFTATNPPPPLPAGDAAPLIVPEGFAPTIFARNITNARVMTRDPKGTLVVSQTSEGKVTALPDLDGNGVADRQIPVLDGLDKPHGILFTCPYTGNTSADQDACTLYVAETGALKTYSYDADTYTATYQMTIATFPTGNGHFTRTLLMHPDGKQLLVSIGSSCNACTETDSRRASVQSIDLETGVMTTYASGLRNSVFMATNYIDGSIWATENGRDIIGDDIPPDEINIIEPGKNYGWPLCYGKNIHDTDFDRKQYVRDPCSDMTPSRIDLPAHSAALGLAFIPEEGWPDGWGNDLLVAYHGSWNRSEPTGYKVVRIDLDQNGNVLGTTDFVTGFLPTGGKEGDAIGRPVGLMAEPGGVVYISDDRAAAIYKVALTEPAR